MVAEVSTPDQKKVIRQLEYYFGDSNLQRDKFLQDEIKKDPEGWISLETMLKFKRLGDMVNGDGKNIVNCLKGSDTKLIQVAEDESKIRRNPEMVVPAFDDNYKRLQKNRTCYVKGFDVEMTLDSLQEFFEPHGSESVYMRRVPLSKQFKGSVFVTFKTQKESDDFMNQTETKYKDTVLTKMTKTAYYDSKKDEKNPSRKQNREDKQAQEDRDEGAMERIIKFSGVTDETVGREQILEKIEQVDFTCFERGKTEGFLLVKKGFVAKELVGKMENNPVQILGAEKVEFVALEGEEAAKAFQVIKDDREALFKKLKDRKGGKGGKGGFKKKAPKNKKITFDDDEPAEKKTKVEE